MTNRRWLSIFCLMLLAAAIALVAALAHVIRLVRRPDYPERASDVTLVLQSQTFTQHNRHCDIVIDGDSTANVGIDPALLTAQTGLTACNLATNAAIVDVLGTLPLDTFLAHNPAPKLIVFQLAPELFYRAKSPWDHTSPYLPLVLLSRNLPIRDLVPILLRHPVTTAQFALYTLKSEFLDHAFAPRPPNPEYQRLLAHALADNGHLDLRFPAIRDCGRRIPHPLYGPVDTAWLRELHRRYESRGIAVLIVAASIPTCDPQYDTFRRDLAPNVDANIAPLPADFFSGGYRHTTPEGTHAETLALAQLISSRNITPAPQ